MDNTTTNILPSAVFQSSQISASSSLLEPTASPFLRIVLPFVRYASPSVRQGSVEYLRIRRSQDVRPVLRRDQVHQQIIHSRPHLEHSLCLLPEGRHRHRHLPLFERWPCHFELRSHQECHSHGSWELCLLLPRLCPQPIRYGSTAALLQRQ